MKVGIVAIAFSLILIGLGIGIILGDSRVEPPAEIIVQCEHTIQDIECGRLHNINDLKIVEVEESFHNYIIVNGKHVIHPDNCKCRK